MDRANQTNYKDLQEYYLTFSAYREVYEHLQHIYSRYPNLYMEYDPIAYESANDAFFINKAIGSAYVGHPAEIACKDLNEKLNRIKEKLRNEYPSKTTEIDYKEKERVLYLEDIRFEIEGKAQHAALSILLSHFKEKFFNDDVYLIEIAQEENPSVDIKKGIKWAENAFGQINKKARENGCENIFDLTDKKVRLRK
jgi:hypothetical protein